MKNMRVLKSVVVAAACAAALVIAVGCSAAPASSSATASSSSASSSAASSEASASASSEVVSSSAVSASSVAASSASASSVAASSASAGALTEETAVAQGYQVFKGTVTVASTKELIALQGVDIDPSVVGGDGTYAVLVFDKATEVTGQSGDGTGPRTESAKMLGIAEHTDYGSLVTEYGDLLACEKLNGQKVTIAAKAETIMFPSDVRLPINEPSAKEIVFL